MAAREGDTAQCAGKSGEVTQHFPLAGLAVSETVISAQAPRSADSWENPHHIYLAKESSRSRPRSTELSSPASLDGRLLVTGSGDGPYLL